MYQFLYLLFFISLINNSISWQIFMRGRSKHGNLGVPILSENYKLPNEQWFTQFLDHFDPTEARVWQQVI